MLHCGDKSAYGMIKRLEQHEEMLLIAKVVAFVQLHNYGWDW